MDTLLRWIHISDIHMGHGGNAYGWDQRLVLEELERDVARQIKAQPEPAVDAILVTGDIGNTGAGRSKTEYDDAAEWLKKVAAAAGVGPERVFVVPGNHDVDRGADGDASVKQIVSDLRAGTRSLDDALADPGARALLSRRMEKYLLFARAFGPHDAADRLLWVHRFTARSGLAVRLVGLNTALLAAGDDDLGKLRVGKTQLGQTLLDVKDDELVLALGHHPLRGGWLADEAEIEPYLKRRVHALLTGHVHVADTEQSRGGSGGSFLRVVAGSAHGDRMPPGIPEGHGYSFGAVVRDDAGKVHVRIVPRKWSAKNASFRPDVDNILEGQTFSEHDIPLSLSLALPQPLAAPAPKQAAAAHALEVVPGEPVPIFVSSAAEDEELRKELEKHIKPLSRSRKAVIAYSRVVPNGAEPAPWIRARLDEARIILLLISKDYIASDDYYEDEVLRAVERHDRGEACVIPIRLRKFAVWGEPFAKLQMLPRAYVRSGVTDVNPTVDSHPAKQDHALMEIAQELRAVVHEMRGEPPPKPDR